MRSIPVRVECKESVGPDRGVGAHEEVDEKTLWFAACRPAAPGGVLGVGRPGAAPHWLVKNEVDPDSGVPHEPVDEARLYQRMGHELRMYRRRDHQTT